MNKFIEILESNKDKYFFGGEENLSPFVSGEFLEKFKETIFARDTHCKYNFNNDGYSEFNISYCKNPNKIKYIDIIINKKGNQYDKVRCMFEKSLDVQKVKKLFIGHTETKTIEKEKFCKMVKQAEIELGYCGDENDEEDVKQVTEYLSDNENEIYEDYIFASKKYNNENKDKIIVAHKFGAETHFYFDLYGKLTKIGFFDDYGYELYVSVKFKEEQEIKIEEQTSAPASEKSINELINLFN